MVTPNLDTITTSLERSLRNCSLNHQHSSSSSGGGGVARTPESPPQDSATPTLELNSEASLPFHWEQCLDLKTGEIYYINWRTGMRVTEDPRTAAEYGGDYYSEDDSSSYDSDGSSAESSPSSSREQWSGRNNNQENCYCQERIENNSNSNLNSNNSVLVVAGCKSCLMYYMVPKQLEICPKCCGQLLHFDRSENAS